MTDKPIRLEFVHFHDVLGDIPCVVHLERKSGGFVIDSIDASDHDGGELDEHALKCIEEKALELALDLDIDAAEASRPEAHV